MKNTYSLGAIEWTRTVASRFPRSPEVLRLEPPPRSRLRGHGT